jgi:hypothetical protein
MARTADEEVSRVNFSIYRRQEKALQKLDNEQPVKGGMSGHVRIALDRYLDLSPEDREKEIPKQFEQIITLLEYMKMKIPSGKSIGEFNVSKGDLMALGFGKYWYQFSSIVELTVYTLGMKKIDVIHEEVIVEMSGMNEKVKKDRIGYKVVFVIPLTRDKMSKIIEIIGDDLRHFGRIKPLTNGDKIV